MESEKNLKTKQVLSAWSAWLHDPQASLLVLNDHLAWQDAAASGLTIICCPTQESLVWCFPTAVVEAVWEMVWLDSEVKGKV